MLNRLVHLDRRWIFLLMAFAVAIPLLIQATFPEQPTVLAEAVFEEIERLNSGDRVLLAWDFDPASEGELGPMATTFARHCAEKDLKLYFLALWPVGQQMIEDTIQNVIEADFPDMVYGEDYVNLGFKSGYEGVIKVIVTDLRQLYPTDARGTNLDRIPMTRDIESIQQMDLIVNVSAGYPGTKEWVQYAVTPYPEEIRMVAGCTGVQAPLLYPYIPEQLPGLLGAIKGAAEYEQLVNDAYSEDEEIPLKYGEALRRMGPQVIAHLLMILLIIVGNVIYFTRQRRPRIDEEPPPAPWHIPTTFLAVMGLGFGIWLMYVTLTRGAGDVYVADGFQGGADSSFFDYEAGSAYWSLSRTIGVWVAAMMTLFIFSFLYRDNPFYKFAEALLIGISAAYWMVLAFWTVIIPNLLANLWPAWIQSWALPGLTPVRADYWWVNFVPLLLGIMLLMRLSSKGAWISRWPLAFIIGTTAGLRLIGFLQADFLSQIRNSIQPLIYVESDASTFQDIDVGASVASTLLIVGMLAALVYFYFSFEHKGAVGKISRVGIWVLMITFGAAFGYTVMGRIALLAIRFEFLFHDWLGII